MARKSLAKEALPEEARAALRELGERLRRARMARRWTVSDFAGRLYVTPVTVRRLEAGHPGTGLGVLASALFVFDLTSDLGGLASLASDRVAAMRTKQYQPQRVRRRAADLPDF